MSTFFEKLKKGMEAEEAPELEEVPVMKKPRVKKTARIKVKKETPVIEPSHKGFVLQNLAGPEGQLAIDVYQTDREMVIRAAIAGVKPEDLDISVEKDMLIIKGVREKPFEEGERSYSYQECFWGPFSREVVLPEEIDCSRIQASLKEGILTIRIPKIERRANKKISVE